MVRMGMRWTAIAITHSVLQAATLAIPAVVFPFNSQVPSVARVNQAYSFQFSASTFAPTDSSFTYSISGQPAWLSLDSSTRTLSGTPEQADTGPASFQLTAADETGAAQMQCTLVVSANPVPQLQGDLSQQLAAEANLSSSNPAVVTLAPGDTFDFHFRQDSFIDAVQRTLYYYATLSDHTPLPAWLKFSPSDLTFSGTVPQLSAFPQSFQIELIASDVPGFAGSAAAFEVVVELSQLVFSPEEQDVTAVPGYTLTFTKLKDQLYLDGAVLDIAKVKSAQVSSLPAWLTFDNSTLALAGAVPPDTLAQNITVTVTDDAGNTATDLLRLSTQLTSDNVFASSIGTLTATPGQSFQYTIPTSVVNETDADLSVVLPTSAQWLSFNNGARELKGMVPSQTKSSAVTATLNARVPDMAQMQQQVFTIDVKAPSNTLASATSSSAQPTGSSTATVTPSPDSSLSAKYRGSTLAGIIVGAVLLLLLLLALLWVCCRRKRREGYQRHPSPFKRVISRPMMPVDPNGIAVITDMQQDVENLGESSLEPVHEEGEEEKPPQIALNLPRNSARVSRWTNRFSRISQASSIGNGEDAIRADGNIPEWGNESTVLHTPHDSFSVPTQMARVSRQLSQMSPSKRALQRLRARRERHESEDSVGLGISGGKELLVPRHSSRRADRRKKRASSQGLSATMERSSCASLSTRGTSVLSTRPSDFPRPPTRSTFTDRSIPNMSVDETGNRKSIRMVARSDSMADGRSMQEKRQSFIRKRASTSLQSPLFSHGSRASLGNRANAHSSMADIDTLAGTSTRRSKRIRSCLTSYTESSSLEPSRSSNRFSQRIRSTFGPNFPRAITRSTLITDEGDLEDNSDDYETVSELSEDSDEARELAAEFALPRNQRNWVLPNEASPTPPPVPPASRQASSYRASTPGCESSAAQLRWRQRQKRASSPLATSSLSRTQRRILSAGKPVHAQHSRLNEPMALVSNDSLNKAKSERPRLVQTNSGRPVSVDKVQRLSSLRAETSGHLEPEADARGGGEMAEDDMLDQEIGGSGLIIDCAAGGDSVRTGKSAFSGPAFI